MGFSGMKGQVFYIDASCPGHLDGREPSGTQTIWPDEVTRWAMNESANVRRYGHDKSYGWQDVVSGIRAMDVTLDAVIRHQEPGLLPAGKYHAGQVVYLKLYPFGNSSAVAPCNALPIKGYFMVERVSYTIDQERGDPVGYTMTLTSKGAIRGLPDDQAPQTEWGEPNWGGFECECSGSGDSTSGSSGSYEL